MPSNHLILCHSLLLLPSIFPSIRVFSNESVLCLRWPKYWSFSFSISSSNEYSGLISRIDWLDLFAVQGLSRVFSNTTVQKYQWNYFNKTIYLKLNAYFNSGTKFYRRKIFSYGKRGINSETILKITTNTKTTIYSKKNSAKMFPMSTLKPQEKIQWSWITSRWQITWWQFLSLPLDEIKFIFYGKIGKFYT